MKTEENLNIPKSVCDRNCMVLSQKEDVQTPFFNQISIGKPTRTIATIDQLRISQERGLQLSMVYF